MTAQEIINYFTVFGTEGDVERWLNEKNLNFEEAGVIIFQGNNYIRNTLKDRYNAFADEYGLPKNQNIPYELTSTLGNYSNEVLKSTGVGAGIATAAALIFGGPVGWAAVGGAALGFGAGRSKIIGQIKTLLISNSQRAAEAYVKYLIYLYESFGGRASMAQLGPTGACDNDFFDDETAQKIWDLFCETADLFRSLLYQEDENYVIHPLISMKIKSSLQKWGDVFKEINYDLSDEYFTLAYDIYTHFDCTVKSVLKSEHQVDVACFIYEYLPLVVSIPNIAFVLANWLDYPMDGNGTTLIKILPAAGCTGRAYVWNEAAQKEFPIWIKARTPFYVPSKSGSCCIVVRNPDKKIDTTLKINNAVGALDKRILFPPCNNSEYYLEKMH